MAYYWETNGLGIKQISVFRGAFGMTLARIPHGGTSIFGISSVVAGFSPRSAPACGHGVPEANAGWSPRLHNVLQWYGIGRSPWEIRVSSNTVVLLAVPSSSCGVKWKPWR